MEGAREIQRALAAGWTGVELWSKEDASQAHWAQSFERQYVAGAKVFEKIAYRSGTESHVALFKQRHWKLDELGGLLSEARGVLVVEGIEKPGNAGAILRTAQAAGVSAVFFADAALDLYGPNVMRNATGAILKFLQFWVPVRRSSRFWKSTVFRYTLPTCTRTRYPCLNWIGRGNQPLFSARKVVG